MTSFGIGAKLRQERVGQGLTVDDISRETKIALRFLEAIEEDDFSKLPGLIFARNFVRQYSLALKLDPDPLLAELPKQDEATVQLPNPPVHTRSSYLQDRAFNPILSSAVWLLLAGGAMVAAYLHFNHQVISPSPRQPAASASPEAASPGLEYTATDRAKAEPPAVAASTSAAPVQVSMTAHEPAWVQLTVDGKTIFTGTLQAGETKEISAAQQVKVLTGNAGGLSISLNGKNIDAIGPPGQVRTVKLTAEGPQFLSRVPPPAPDPL